MHYFSGKGCSEFLESMHYCIGILKSALFFHDLTDREPSQYSVTVRRGYSPTRLKAEGLSVYTIKPELFDVELSSGQTPFGHTVPVYDMERTICDLLRSRSRIWKGI